MILGGEGYKIGKEYSQDDSGEINEGIYCYNFKENIAFELNLDIVRGTRDDYEAFHTGSGFQVDND